MHLPAGDEARVDRDKILGYLLCASHPDGRTKAAFFARFGFTRQQWPTLARSLATHGANHPVAETT